MTVLWSPQSRKGLEGFSEEKRERIIDKVVEFDKKERGNIKKIAEGLWRLREGDYRVYYHQDEDKTHILRVVHRKHAYREDLVKALKQEIEGL
ncbi:MAG: type II toxin-antitoxin system RelE family toxin [Candidatus Natronoplasma sp.]